MKMLFAAVLMACVSVGRSNPRQLLRPSVIQCPIQDFVHPDDHIQPTHETVIPEFKPFTIKVYYYKLGNYKNYRMQGQIVRISQKWLTAHDEC